MKRRFAFWLVKIAARIDHQAILILLLEVRDSPEVPAATQSHW